MWTHEDRSQDSGPSPSSRARSSIRSREGRGHRRADGRALRRIEHGSHRRRSRRAPWGAPDRAARSIDECHRSVPSVRARPRRAATGRDGLVACLLTLQPGWRSHLSSRRDRRTTRVPVALERASSITPPGATGNPAPVPTWRSNRASIDRRRVPPPSRVARVRQSEVRRRRTPQWRSEIDRRRHRLIRPATHTSCRTCATRRARSQPRPVLDQDQIMELRNKVLNMRYCASVAGRSRALPALGRGGRTHGQTDACELRGATRTTLQSPPAKPFAVSSCGRAAGG